MNFVSKLLALFRRPAALPAHRKARLALEAMEDRTAPAVLTRVSLGGSWSTSIHGSGLSVVTGEVVTWDESNSGSIEGRSKVSGGEVTFIPPDQGRWGAGVLAQASIRLGFTDGMKALRGFAGGSSYLGTDIIKVFSSYTAVYSGSATYRVVSTGEPKGTRVRFTVIATDDPTGGSVRDMTDVKETYTISGAGTFTFGEGVTWRYHRIVARVGDTITFSVAGSISRNSIVHWAHLDGWSEIDLLFDTYSSIRDLKVNSVAWNTAKGGARINYLVRGDIPEGTAVGLYWASGPTAADRIGAPIYEEDAPVSTDGRDIERSFRVPGSRFLRQPAGATHLVLVADPVNGVPEDSESNNVAWQAWAPRVFVENGTLYVLGSRDPNEARVFEINGYVHAMVYSTDGAKPLTGPGVSARASYSQSAVMGIRFEGWGGNDSFYRSAGVRLPVTARGGDGADRYLVPKAAPYTPKGNSEDATVFFKNGDKPWSDTAVWAVDLGLRLLVHETGNARLLKGADGSTPITFVRRKAIPSDAGNPTIVFGQNLGDSRIVLANAAFKTKAFTALVAIHEVAHNWPGESGGQGWKDLSGWYRLGEPHTEPEENYTPVGKGWFYLTARSADFVHSYGRTNPDEDWATVWESYFHHNHPQLLPVPSGEEAYALVSEDKAEYLTIFFDNLSDP